MGAKQHAFLPQAQILIHIPPLKIWTTLEKMKLNEPGRQKLCTYYIEALKADTASKDIFSPTTGLKKREPLIALGSHQGEGGGGT